MNCLGHENIVKLLIENGADINSQDEYGIKPLHYSVYNGNCNTFNWIINFLSISWYSTGYENISRILIENGTDIESKNKYEMTSLMLAAIRGRL